MPFQKEVVLGARPYTVVVVAVPCSLYMTYSPPPMHCLLFDAGIIREVQKSFEVVGRHALSIRQIVISTGEVHHFSSSIMVKV